LEPEDPVVMEKTLIETEIMIEVGI